ncbi:hypothetical protein GMA11_01385 [Granulicatella sp. zg-ZJ]|uniref:hypothetical protein n=1 Tax=unclassified Granulicatella TaxID=2630493 RepID=UPI0013C2825C|nr:MULTISPECIES: hypothetical protein [unclassified Granulicatella]MBS4749967.1 hypothetical protein [Carnobacteriaceae bacterium zg-ZUI78]NEW62037.1 hypothetical protein [Granulicatella sp. zg-ZJ]NEW66165.1 hypothetical protein [Granulicatella sp. zg-84]QMI86077.1 hypothetical protein H1220_01510 [Carnobacteriaceae bacterium zg-84]
MKKHIQYIIMTVIIICGLFWYSSQSVFRSLYNTDPNLKAEVLGNLDEQMTLKQYFVPEDSTISEIEVAIKEFSHDTSSKVKWSLVEVESNKVIKSGEFELNKSTPTGGKVVLSKFYLDMTDVTLKKGSAYYIEYKGNIGDLFKVTKARQKETTIIVNGVEIDQATFTKIKYNGFHLQTFIILLLLSVYIIVFMSVMTRFFR